MLNDVDVQKRVEQIQTMLAARGFKSFEISVNITDLRVGAAGMANYGRNEISISSNYLREFREQTITNTVAHEVCHLYTHKYFPYHKQHHGPEFRQLMNILGLKGETYHQMMLVNKPKGSRTIKRYVYVNTNGQECVLTTQKHNKFIAGTANYIYKGLSISYTGRCITY